MQITGIVAEYNPFHTGHRYHIEKAKAETGADGIVVIMSGSFVQRGEPAVFDKWTRAFHALAGGADLVLELPVPYALSSAEHFARGAVEILRATGVISTLSFGSECGDISRLRETAAILKEEPPAFKAALHQALENGKSYPAAKMEAVGAVNPELAQILKEPNNTLSVSYLRFAEGLQTHTVLRKGAGHLETDEKDGFLSATAIRSRIQSGADVSAYMPLQAEAEPHFLEMYESLILYALRSTDWQSFASVTEPVKKRLAGASRESLASLLETAKTKNIVMASLKRALLHILLQNPLPGDIPASYIRVLGFTDAGAEILKRMKKTAALPVITRPAAYKEKDVIWETEQRATDIYFMSERLSGQDLRRAPVQYHRKEEQIWNRL